MRPLPENTASRGMSRRTKERLVNVMIDVVLTAVCLLMILPLVFLVSNAFKTPQEMLAWPPTVIPDDPTVANFKAVLGDTPLLRWIGNSILFSVLSTVCILATSSISGYILGKFRYRALNVFFAIILATAIVPFEVYMIPLYFQAKALGILNSTTHQHHARALQHGQHRRPGVPTATPRSLDRAGGRWTSTSGLQSTSERVIS